MNRCILSIVLGCFIVSGSASAFPKGNSSMRMLQLPTFSEIDTNQDTLISVDEFDAFQTHRQEARKTDGRLLRNATASRDMFEYMDVDHSGLVDTSEFQSHIGLMRNSRW